MIKFLKENYPLFFAMILICFLLYIQNSSAQNTCNNLLLTDKNQCLTLGN